VRDQFTCFAKQVGSWLLGLAMAQSHAQPKYMTLGEGGTAAALGILAFVSVVIAAKAYTPEYAFHAYLFAAASVAAIFAIVKRYFERSLDPVPLIINGKPNYNMGPVKFATVASVFWGIAGFTVGLWIALELAFPAFNLDLSFLSFGRLRPLHTSAVIFAFGGNVLLATSMYVVQRTSRARMVGDIAPWFVVLGYNFFIVIAGTGYLLGITQAKEYAEPEWYADLWLTIVWLVYLLVFLGTIMRRTEPHIYVANWFYLAFILTIAVLHLGNNSAVPVSVFSPKSYVVWAGVQDAMVQWWYGHNAVGFFLTAGFLGIMYYFIPKRAERPIYSYRLSIIHFAGLDADARHDVLGHAVDAVLGRHDQRPDDALGRLGQAAHRPGAAHDGSVRRLLRHVDFRRAGHVDQGGELAVALHRLDDRSRAFRRARLGRLRVVRSDLLPGAVALEQAALFAATGRLALLDRDYRHRSLHHLDVGRGHPAGIDVARL
jgi:Cytochrome C and Quinol oxidase polypeptide I